MCECGCVANDKKFKFPANGKSFYLLTLSTACMNCDAPPGISIELIESGHGLYEEYSAGDSDYLEGDLPFEKWPDSKGVAIVCGMTRSEFIKAMSSHLIGIDSNELGDDGVLDDVAAETILEEMYENSQVRPYIPKG